MYIESSSGDTQSFSGYSATHARRHEAESRCLAKVVCFSRKWDCAKCFNGQMAPSVAEPAVHEDCIGNLGLKSAVEAAGRQTGVPESEE